MIKKTKKRVQVLKDKLQNRRQQLAGAKKQLDEPHTIKRLTEEISRMEAELNELQSS